MARLDLTFDQFVIQASQGEGLLGPEDLEEVLCALRVVVVSEMKKRGLWTAPPSFLGYPGTYWWSETEILDELVWDVFGFIFVDRLGGLIDTLNVKLKPTIGPMVLLNVRHFLTGRQRESDPLGYLVFGRLKAAVLKALEWRVLFLHGIESVEEDEEPLIHNQSQLTYRSGRFFAAALDLVREAARFLNDSLLPDLVRKRGRAVPDLIERFTRHLADLGQRLDGFLFRDMNAELKGDARRRFRAMGLQEEDIALGESQEDEAGLYLIRRVEGIEETPRQWAERCRWILRRVEIFIEDYPFQKDREPLWDLWSYLRLARLDPRLWTEDLHALTGEDLGLGDQHPTRSALAEAVGLSTKRLSRLLPILRNLVGSAIEESTVSALSPEVARRMNGTFRSGELPGRLQESESQQSNAAVRRQTGEPSHV